MAIGQSKRPIDYAEKGRCIVAKASFGKVQKVVFSNAVTQGRKYVEIAGRRQDGTPHAAIEKEVVTFCKLHGIKALRLNVVKSAKSGPVIARKYADGWQFTIVCELLKGKTVTSVMAETLKGYIPESVAK